MLKTYEVIGKTDLNGEIQKFVIQKMMICDEKEAHNTEYTVTWNNAEQIKNKIGFYCPYDVFGKTGHRKLEPYNPVKFWQRFFGYWISEKRNPHLQFHIYVEYREMDYSLEEIYNYWNGEIAQKYLIQEGWIR